MTRFWWISSVIARSAALVDWRTCDRVSGKLSATTLLMALHIRTCSRRFNLKNSTIDFSHCCSWAKSSQEGCLSASRSGGGLFPEAIGGFHVEDGGTRKQMLKLMPLLTGVKRRKRGRVGAMAFGARGMSNWMRWVFPQLWGYGGAIALFCCKWGLLPRANCQ